MLQIYFGNILHFSKGCYNQEEWLEEFLDNIGVFHNGSESEENYNQNIEAVVCRCSSK